VFFESALLFRAIQAWLDAAPQYWQTCVDRRWNPALTQNIDKSTFAAPVRLQRA
jgi:hypothetical protein